MFKEVWEYGTLVKKEEVPKIDKSPDIVLKKSTTIENELKLTEEVVPDESKKSVESQPTQQEIEEIEKIKQEERCYQKTAAKGGSFHSEIINEHEIEQGENFSGERKEFNLNTDMNSERTVDYAGDTYSLLLDQYDMLHSTNQHLLTKTSKI